MAASISLTKVLFSKYPLAPALIARSTCTSPVYVVSTMMRASGNSARIATIASIPFISGICRSMSVTSGLCRRN